MTMSKSFEALRRANPRADVGFHESVVAAAEAVRARLATDTRRAPSRSRRRFVGTSIAGAALALTAAAAVSLTVTSSGGGPGVEGAVAAMRTAATLSAASAEQSGTAILRMTHNGALWAGITVRWNGGDVAVSNDVARPPRRAGLALLVVDGTLYGKEPRHGWVALGSPKSIDPDSGTTPAEYLAAVREDIGGETLRRVTERMTGLTTRQLDDGSTVYSGSVAAGVIARETGFKEGQQIRVLPFGYVAHDEAADPASPLDVAVTVGADGVVREIAVTWGTSGSAWTYTVIYRALGATAAPAAPANAISIRELRGLG
jgi:hypothetical protein